MSKAGYPSGWSPPQERIRFRARRVVTRSSTAIESCLLPALGQPCHLTRRGHVHRHRGGPRGSDPRVIPRPSDCFASSDRSGRSGAVYGIHKSTRQKPEYVRVPFDRQGQFRKRVTTDGRRWSVPSALTAPAPRVLVQHRGAGAVSADGTDHRLPSVVTRFRN